MTVSVVARTHTVDIYRGSGMERSSKTGRQRPKWSRVKQAEEWNIQPRTAALRPTAQGEADKATFEGFAPAGSVVREDDRVVVTEGRDYGTLKVQHAGDPGNAAVGDWDLEVDLIKVDEQVTGS